MRFPDGIHRRGRIMRINMSILADWLSQYNIQRDIKQGTNSILGLRFFMGDLPSIEKDFIYVGKAEDAFADMKLNGSVLLLNGYDMVFVHGESMETVINSLFACMDYYNAWEINLKEMALQPNCLQNIVNTCSELFQAHVSLLDMKGKVLALGQPKETPIDDYIAQSISETSAVPQSILYAPFYDENNNLTRDMKEQPALYHSDLGWRIIGTYLRIDEERTGAMIIYECKKTLTQGDCAIVQQIIPVLCSAIQMGEYPGIQSTSLLFQELLKGGKNQDVISTLTERLVMNGKKHPWVLFLFRCMGNGYQIGIGRLYELLQGITYSGIITVYEGEVVLLISEFDTEEFLSEVRKTVILSQFIVGISLPFSDLAEMAFAYRQAAFAAEYCTETGVRFARELAFSYLIQCMKENTRELSLHHPSKVILKSYDSEKGSELYKTLIVYLENERNMTNTAKALFIHRNTLTARIDRIKQLLGSDLDDPQERIYILLSEYM